MATTARTPPPPSLSCLRRCPLLCELFSSTVGISADIASMTVALAESVEYLGLKNLSLAGQSAGGPWTGCSARRWRS
jgi:hypothetical protein